MGTRLFLKIYPALIGKKYRFVLLICSKSFMPNAEVTSFQVIRADMPVDKTLSSTVLAGFFLRKLGRQFELLDYAQ